MYAEMLRKIVADGEHPAFARIVSAGVFDAPIQGPDEDFEHGLTILDAIEALIKNRDTGRR